MRILVTGSAGQLGTTIANRLARDHSVAAYAREDLDLTRPEAVMAGVHRERPEAIINCAAYNDVDAAEDHSVAALEVNAFGVQTLARAAARVDALFVHYSTDFVFDGETNRPYLETDTPNPQSVYATSKLLGEWFARDAPRHYVLRVESLFGGAALDRSEGKARGSSLDRIVDAVLAGREVRAFLDRTVSPSYVDDVAGATAALLTAGAPFGLYHCVNSGMATWHEVAELVARELDCPIQLVGIDLQSVNLRARRPRFCALSNAKLAQAGIQMPQWPDAVRRYLARRRAQAGTPSP